MGGRRKRSQAGFSLVEMLMTAFVLAVGILGLTMLQVMSLQSSRGGRNLTTAVQVADHVMDQLEQEGRLSWLNITDTAIQNPVAVGTLHYIGKLPLAAGAEGFDNDGQFAANVPDPVHPPAGVLFVATTTQSAPVGAAGTGVLSDFTVLVEFFDAVDSTKAPVKRSVTLTRRILHG